MEKNDAIIFGAGPAGLAAALKLAQAGNKIIVIEKGRQVGGLCKTLRYKDNYFDLGGHRFFSKSEEVNNLWKETLGSDFLVRPRLSRIYYRNKFFNYPITILNALAGLGMRESIRIAFDYLKARLRPSEKENNFEQWVSNRFGKALYKHFFKSYTEKLWGIPCDQIQAEWAAQRIRGLSLASALRNAVFPHKKGVLKTLITKFNYPKYGPGMMYEKMAENIEKASGQILKETEVIRINHANSRVNSIILKNSSGSETEYTAQQFVSSMPITALIKRLCPAAPPEAMAAAKKLHYRSFIAVNMVFNSADMFPDNWIYVHSPEVKLARVQNFKNWSPAMMADNKQTTLGLEYFCDENDELWNMKDAELIELGLSELEKIGLGENSDFTDGFVIRAEKAYPVYDSNYTENIEIIRKYLENFKNLQTIGRYGMFKYNNMDHSILTGIRAAENILGEKHDLWKINCDNDYQEEV
jgi:protoporphyrinogen oxidase